MTKELVMFAQRGAPLEDSPPARRSPSVEEPRHEAGAYRLVAAIGLVVTIIGALAVTLARWRYANPPDHQLIDLQGTFLVTFGTQLGVTALAFGLPLAVGGAALWLRARRDAITCAVPAEVPRAVVVLRRRS
jgi:hypothetical protein